MRDRHEEVTRYVTGESQYPVPSRPYPARPALYIDRGDFKSNRPVSDAQPATSGHPASEGGDWTC